MKNLGIKIFSVLVILLFCLSPLGAIDLNQGYNVTHTNHNGTDIKDVNDTIKDTTVKVNDSDVEIKSVNDTAADLDNNESDVESKDISLNDTNSSQKLNEKVDPELHLKVDDINVGETAILKMWCSEEDLVYLPVTVTITGPNYSDEFDVRVWRSQGVNEFKIKDLPAGNYVVTAYSPGTSCFYKPTKRTAFLSVNKHKINLKTQVDDVEMGKTPVLRVTSEKGLKGNVTVYSNWSGENFTVDASHESFSYQLDRNMAPGNYCCIVTYSGDDTHDSAISASFFSVNKHDPNATVEVDDLVQGDDIFIKFHANKALNCDVKYVVLTVPSSASNSSLNGGSIMHVKLVNGEANATLENSLGPGRYFVSGTVEGDDNFNSAHFSKEFKVNPA